MWNRARDKSTPRKEKSKVVESIMEKLEGALSIVATRHDSARVIQFAYSSEARVTERPSGGFERPHRGIVQSDAMTIRRSKLFDYCKARALRRKLLSALERHGGNLSMQRRGSGRGASLPKALSQKEQRWLFQEFYGRV